jgi:thymidylate synthase
MTVTQRSADLVCGVPSNVIQYAFLMHLYSSIAGLKPGNLQMNFGNLHVYKSHLEQPEWQELLSRSEDPPSELNLSPLSFSCLKSIVPIGFMYEPDAAHAKCFTLANYEPQSGLKFPVVTTPGQYKA